MPKYHQRPLRVGSCKHSFCMENAEADGSRWCNANSAATSLLSAGASERSSRANATVVGESASVSHPVVVRPRMYVPTGRCIGLDQPANAAAC